MYTVVDIIMTTARLCLDEQRSAHVSTKLCVFVITFWLHKFQKNQEMANDGH